MMVSFTDALKLVDDTSPAARLYRAATMLLSELGFAAAAVTAVQRHSDEHDAIIATGYDPANVAYLCSTYVNLDPKYRAVTKLATPVLGWDNFPDFAQSTPATRWLLPSGIVDGASVCLRDRMHREIGSLHVSTRSRGLTNDQKHGIVQLGAFAARVVEQIVARSSFSLSPRETEIAQLIAEGLSNRQISDRLWLSMSTVSTHVENILKKLGASNRTRAATLVERYGLGRPD